MASDQSRFRAAHSTVRAMIVRGVTITVAFAVASAALPVRAQLPVPEPADLSGSWVSPRTEAVMGRTDTVVPGDWTGMPLNAAGRAMAQSYAGEMLAEPEHICQMYSQWHLVDTAFNLRISSMTGGSTDQIQAWKLQPTEVVGGMTIWMNGQPPPSKYADHPRGGFTTGQWKGDTLIAYTTDMKRAPSRVNGAFHSDEATMTTAFIPLDNELLIVVYILHDPEYLTQSIMFSRAYYKSIDRPVATSYPPCTINYEGVPEGDVPFYLPGKNPLLSQMMQIYHIPEYATAGGAETMYPAFRDKLKEQYLKLYPTFPKKCTTYCHLLQ
jgi:hypothetical protein